MRRIKLWSGAAAATAIAIWVAGCGGGGGSSVLPSQHIFTTGGSPTPNVSPSPRPTGSPNPSPSPTARPTPTPGPIAMTHVITWQDDTGLPNQSFTWAQIAPYVNWSVVDPGDNANAQSVGIKTVLYTDPNRVDSNSPEWSQDESEFAHDCSNNRITIIGTQTVTYLTDPTSTVLESLWQQHLATYNQGGHANYNVVFDDTPVVSDVSAMPCGFSQSAWSAAQNLMNTGLNYPIIFNGLGNLADGMDQLSPAMALLPTTVGGMIEGCYSNYSGQQVPKLQVWQTFENTEIQVLADRKLLVCRGFDTTPDISAQVQRLYMYGSFLLTYDPALAIFSPKFKPISNGFWIQPENQLIALDPVVMQPSNIDQLSLSANVYGRQYANCYYAGNWIGSCASVVNSDSVGISHPMPWTNLYHHTLVLSGGDILDGGTASTNGPAPPSSIDGSTAIIEIQ
jgi:hypothetical protein